MSVLPSCIVQMRRSDGSEKTLLRLLKPSYGVDRPPNKLFPRKCHDLIFCQLQDFEVSLVLRKLQLTILDFWGFFSVTTRVFGNPFSRANNADP